MPQKHLLVLILALGFVIPAATAEAGILILEQSGTFGAGSTLDATDVSGVGFSYSAVFDSAADTVGDDGYGVFAAKVTFSIDGLGTFTSDPLADVSVLLVDPSVNGGGVFGDFAAGLVDSAASAGFFGVYTTATPGFNADTPSSTLMSGNIRSDGVFPFVVSLATGDTLTFVGGIATGPTATLSSVPEPTSILIMSMGVGIVGFTARRRRQRQIV